MSADRHGSEARAMDRRGAEPEQGVPVRSRPIALVAGEPVLGIPAIHLDHLPVTGYLGENRRGADRGDARVASHHGARRTRQGRTTISVDEDLLRRRVEPSHRLAHRLHRRLENVDGIDHAGVDSGDGNSLPHAPGSRRSSSARRPRRKTLRIRRGPRSDRSDRESPPRRPLGRQVVRDPLRRRRRRAFHPNDRPVAPRRCGHSCRNHFQHRLGRFRERIVSQCPVYPIELLQNRLAAGSG